MSHASDVYIGRRTKPISVPKSLVEGNKFMKWDDDGVILVTLQIDPKGYILYWRDQNKEAAYLDISQITDIRTGKFARQPKDARVRETVMTSTQDSQQENKLLTISYGSVDMVNVNFVNFVSLVREVDKILAEVLFACTMNIKATNASPLVLLEKYHTILSVVTELENKIRVKRIMKMLVPKDDYKRVEQALDSERMPSKKHDFITDAQFKFDHFLRVYHKLCGRHDVDAVFLKLSSQGQYISVEKFTAFLNQEQRDPRLNEVLYPYYDVQKAHALIQQFEPIKKLAEDGRLSCEGFLRFLLSEENAVMPHEKLGVCHDMTQPLSHYFINSSHNTYLTGHQFTGKSTVEIYRQVLLTGCRCIELDVWDGKGVDEEPIITHGFTMCTEVSCKEVLEAIAEAAFKTSEYPVILSIENHLSSKQQAKLARYCVSVFGDMLLTDALESNPLEPGVPLPSPESLKRRILIKNKKRHINEADNVDKKLADGGDNSRSGNSTDSATLGIRRASHDATASSQDVFDDFDWELDAGVLDGSKAATEEYLKKRRTVMAEKGTAGQEVEAGQHMSALVNYIEPVRFQSFEKHADKNRSYECTSFVETQATTILKSHPVGFVNFNKRQISRVYPKGTRVDSSNYMPQIFWNAGCQLVALNFQTLDLPMQLNLSLFDYNGRCGYLLKPDFMRRPDRSFDPFTDSTVDGIVAGTLEVRIISGQFLSERKCGSYVEVEMFGIPVDTVRRKFRTKVVPNNVVNPVYEENPFIFKKIIMPSLASLRLAVYNDTGTSLLGHRVLPVEGLRPGYRHVGLRNEFNQPQGIATLFVHIKVKDYVMDKFAAFAEALSNPIAYQSDLEKRAKQLAVLEDDAADELPVVKIGGQDYTDSIPPDYNIGAIEVSDVCTAVSSRVLEAIPSTRPPPARPPNRQESPIKYASDSHPRAGSMTTVRPKEGDGNNSETAKNSILNMLVGRSTSVPGSPHQSMLNLSIEGSKTVSKPTGARLCDADVIEVLTVSQLKESKLHNKLTSKHNKELDLLKRKHDKVERSKLQSQQAEVEKLFSATGSRTNLSTIERAIRTKAGKQFISYADAKHHVAKDNGEHSAQLMSLLRRNNDEIIALCCDHFRICYELQKSQAEAAYRLLEEIANVRHKDQVARLEKMHDREVVDLKRQLDLQNWDEMKSLSQKYMEKSELARIRKEATQKHICLAVQERQNLKDLLASRKQEAVTAYQQLVQQIALDRKRTEEFLHKLHDGNCAAASLTSHAILFNGDNDISSNRGSNASFDSTVSSVPGETYDSTVSSLSGATYLVDVRKKASSSSFPSEFSSRASSSACFASSSNVSNVVDWTADNNDIDCLQSSEAPESAGISFNPRSFFDSSDDEVESTRL